MFSGRIWDMNATSQPPIRLPKSICQGVTCHDWPWHSIDLDSYIDYLVGIEDSYRNHRKLGVQNERKSNITQ